MILLYNVLIWDNDLDDNTALVVKIESDMWSCHVVIDP